MLALIRSLRQFALGRRHNAAKRKIRLIERLDLPEDLRLAAIRRVQRRFEEHLDRFTRGR